MPSWDGQLVAADTCPGSKRSVSTTGLVGYTEIVYLVRMVEGRTRRMICVNAVVSKRYLIQLVNYSILRSLI